MQKAERKTEMPEEKSNIQKVIEQLERVKGQLKTIGEKEDYTDVAIQAVKEIGMYHDGKMSLVPTDVFGRICEENDKYQDIERRLDEMFGGQLPLESYVDRLEEVLSEPGKTHPVNARILTHEDAEKWEEYKAIGTPEECREAMEKQKAKRPVLVTRANGNIKFYPCPNCSTAEKYISVYPKQQYCDKCGQKLDWPGEEDK